MADNNMYKLLDSLRSINERFGDDEKWICPYCGTGHSSPSGTGSDVACCGEIGHAEKEGSQEENDRWGTTDEAVDPTGPMPDDMARQIGVGVNYDSLEIDGVDSRDHPDYSDAYFSYGEYTDGTPMTDTELEALRDAEPDLLYSLINGRQADAGDAARDSMRDRQYEEGVEEAVNGNLDGGASTLSQVRQSVSPDEWNQFVEFGEMSDALYDAAYEYYTNSGEMPYGVAKARDGDPMQWVADRLERDLQMSGELQESADKLAALKAKKEKLEDKIEAIVKDGGRVGLGDPLSHAHAKVVNDIKKLKKGKVKEGAMDNDLDSIRKLSGLYKPVTEAVETKEREDKWANTPSEKYLDADTMINTMSGGPNAPHAQINPNNPGDNPMAMDSIKMRLEKMSLNLKEEAQKLEQNLRRQYAAESHDPTDKEDTQAEKDDYRARWAKHEADEEETQAEKDARHARWEKYNKDEDKETKADRQARVKMGEAKKEPYTDAKKHAEEVLSKKPHGFHGKAENAKKSKKVYKQD